MCKIHGAVAKPSDSIIWWSRLSTSSTATTLCHCVNKPRHVLRALSDFRAQLGQSCNSHQKVRLDDVSAKVGVDISEEIIRTGNRDRRKEQRQSCTLVIKDELADDVKSCKGCTTATGIQARVVRREGLEPLVLSQTGQFGPFCPSMIGAKSG